MKKIKIISIVLAVVLLIGVFSTPLFYFFNEDFKNGFDNVVKVEQTTENNEESSDNETSSSNLEDLNLLKSELASEKLKNAELEKQLSDSQTLNSTLTSENEQLKLQNEYKDEHISSLPVFSVQISDYNSSSSSGVYSIVVDKSTSVINDFTDDSLIFQDISYCSDVYIFILPEIAGNRLSRFSYRYNLDTSPMTVNNYLTLNGETHGFSFTSNGTTYLEAVDGVHDGIELFYSEYSNSIFEFSDSYLTANVSYLGYLQYYSYICIKINNLQQTLRCYTWYEPQEYDVTVYRSVFKDNIPQTSTIFQSSAEAYGVRTIGDVCSACYSSAFIVEPIWYYNNVAVGNEIPEEDFSKYFTSDLVLYCSYDLTSNFDFKYINFYSWSEDKSCYSQLDFGNDYFFSGVEVVSNSASSTDVSLNNIGLIYSIEDASNYIWTWADEPKTNFIFTFDGNEWLTSDSESYNNSFDRVTSVKLTSLPSNETSYNNLISSEFIYFTAEELLAKINETLNNDDKYDYSTILNIFDENICWNMVDLSNDVATIEFIGDETSPLFGKTITASVLTTDVEISSPIYAVQIFCA